MALLFQDNALLELMQDFYVLTGMRIVLYDENFVKLASYPSRREAFCACMRENPAFDRKCLENDLEAHKHCIATKNLYIYKCHAGLVEAIVPITEGARIIGYIMCGQITDIENKGKNFEKLSALCREYGVESDLGELIGKIKYRSERQIRAASKILEACTEYVRLKEIVQPSGKQLIDSIELFVETHIKEEIDVDRICCEFNISRTRLYEVIRPYTDGGIAAFIKNKRLEHAKNLIKTTSLPIPQIASESGFSDYNYFLRVFKRKYGVSSKKMRQ
ncbi:MAG: PocR ligand-binding domain-containing protein [Clostridia bacterium]|nr:PocR ligand-binding domain-containing protein [Clostridia bacterium]